MTKKHAIPTHETISRAGDRLEITGIIISTLCLVIGAVTLFASGNGAPFIGITFGLLLMITGYTKKTSAATMAMFIIATHENEREIAKNMCAEQ